MTVLDNFGILYTDSNGKQFLYGRYRTPEAVAEALTNDPKLRKLEKEDVFLIDLTNCPQTFYKKETKQIKEKSGGVIKWLHRKLKKKDSI